MPRSDLQVANQAGAEKFRVPDRRLQSEESFRSDDLPNNAIGVSVRSTSHVCAHVRQARSSMTRWGSARTPRVVPSPPQFGQFEDVVLEAVVTGPIEFAIIRILLLEER